MPSSSIPRTIFIGTRLFPVPAKPHRRRCIAALARCGANSPWWDWTRGRVQLKGAKACLETPVRGTDIVSIVDIAKGGLRFVSSKRYERGDWLRVAAPYTAGGNNIFVSAEIVRVHKAAGDGLPGEYALKFRPT